LDKALALYQDSLASLEQIGDIQGKAASLHNMANIYIQRREWQVAETLLHQALSLAQQVGSLEHVAFAITKLGQVAQGNLNQDDARRYYADALALFQKIGMVREAGQVRQMLAGLDGRSPSTATPTQDDIAQFLAQLSPEDRAQAEAQLETAARLQQAVQQADAAAERRLWPAAITHQQDAVAHARTLAQQTGQRDALVQLSVLLYNLAGYYQQADRHHEAIAAYEEVVALDEQTGHEDLESDRQALAQARQLAETAASTGSASLPADIPAEFAALLAQLSPANRAAFAQMPLEQQEQMLQALAHIAALPPDEQEALARRAQFEQVESNLLDQLSQLFDALRQNALTGEQQWAAADQIIAIAGQLAGEEALGEQRHALAALLRCAAARLRGAEAPPIPAAYATHWAEWV